MIVRGQCLCSQVQLKLSAELFKSNSDAIRVSLSMLHTSVLGIQCAHAENGRATAKGTVQEWLFIKFLLSIFMRVGLSLSNYIPEVHVLATQTEKKR